MHIGRRVNVWVLTSYNEHWAVDEPVILALYNADWAEGESIVIALYIMCIGRCSTYFV